MSRIVCRRVLLVELVGRADKKIRKVVAGLISVEYKCAIKYRVGVDVHLLEAHLDSGLKSVAAHDSGEAFACRKRVIGLVHIGDRNPHHKGALKDCVFDSFELGSQGEDAARHRICVEPLGSQAGSESAGWLAYDVSASHVAEMQFVYRGRAERLGIAQTDQLRTTLIQAVETRNGCAPLSARKWVTYKIIIEKVVRRRIPKTHT